MQVSVHTVLQNYVHDYWEAMCCKSAAKWPNCANDLHPCCKVLMSILESPSNTIRSKPTSAANTTAILAASASPSMTVNGRGIFWESDAITKPCPFLITSYPDTCTVFFNKEVSIKIYFIPWCIWRTPSSCYRDTLSLKLL